jgi:hypothetical protein
LQELLVVWDIDLDVERAVMKVMTGTRPSYYCICFPFFACKRPYAQKISGRSLRNPEKHLTSTTSPSDPVHRQTASHDRSDLARVA